MRHTRFPPIKRATSCGESLQSAGTKFCNSKSLAQTSARVHSIRKFLIDRHKHSMMSDWHATCLTTYLSEN